MEDIPVYAVCLVCFASLRFCNDYSICSASDAAFTSRTGQKIIIKCASTTVLDREKVLISIRFSPF